MRSKKSKQRVRLYMYATTRGGGYAHSRVFEKLLITLLRLLRVASSLRIHVQRLSLSYVDRRISRHNCHFFDEQCVLSPEYAFGCKFLTAKASIFPRALTFTKWTTSNQSRRKRIAAPNKHKLVASMPTEGTRFSSSEINIESSHASPMPSPSVSA